MGLIGTMENWNKQSCHQSFTNIVHLQLNTLQRGWRSVNNLNSDWDCSNYPYRHQKTFHCAEKKAFAYGIWTLDFFYNGIYLYFLIVFVIVL